MAGYGKGWLRCLGGSWRRGDVVGAGVSTRRDGHGLLVKLGPSLPNATQTTHVAE